MRLSCAAAAGTIIFPLTVPGVFLAGVLDRVGPRRLNYPAVLVTPPAVFTRSRRSRGTGANGNGPPLSGSKLQPLPSLSQLRLRIPQRRQENIITQMWQR